MDNAMNTGQQRQRIWKPNPIIFNLIGKDKNVIKQLVRPENALEQNIISDAYWQEGAFWGEPRHGHPEGKIIYHIQEVLANVNKVTTDPKLRNQLRLITIIHDTFKHLEEQTRPRTDWSKHHAILALNFAKKYIKDKAILDVIELHDEAYYAWRSYRYGRLELCHKKMQNLAKRLGENMQLFYLFFKCDTQTGNKDQMSIVWFESQVKNINIVSF